jgi:DNA-binding CsgD family transcriptional regulator
MPPAFTNEGLVAAIEARARRPGLPVLVLSQYVEQLYARELMLSGANGVGYLLKDRVAEVRTFVEAVRTVAGGGTVLDPDVVTGMLTRHDRSQAIGRLTPREREVLTLMAEGRSNAAIAGKMVVTAKAVDKHRSRDHTGQRPGDEDRGEPAARLPLPPVPVQRTRRCHHVAEQVGRREASTAMANAAARATAAVQPAPSTLPRWFSLGGHVPGTGYLPWPRARFAPSR